MATYLATFKKFVLPILTWLKAEIYKNLLIILAIFFDFIFLNFSDFRDFKQDLATVGDPQIIQDLVYPHHKVIK